MKIEMNTYELQDIVLALICNDSAVLKTRKKEVKRLIDVFSELNFMCNDLNDFTLIFTVNEKRNS